MRYTNNDLIVAFGKGATKGRTHDGNLYIVGDTLVNYSTIIARRTLDGILLNDKKYSRTTSKIQTMIRRLSNKGIEVVEVSPELIGA